MAEVMIERLLLVIGHLSAWSRRRWRCRRASAARRQARPRSAAAPETSSTLVGLSMPRQLLLSVRTPASSVSMIGEARASPTSAIGDFGRGIDGAMDHRLDLRLGLPALGDDENFGEGKDGRHERSSALHCNVRVTAWACLWQAHRRRFLGQDLLVAGFCGNPS